MRKITINSDLALLNDVEVDFHTRESNANHNSVLKLYRGISGLIYTCEHLYVSASFTDEYTHVD